MAFQQLKEYLSRLPIMSSPEVDKVLFAYLAVAPHAVSFVLIREDSGVQRPVYYISKSLHEVEVRYLSKEKGHLGRGPCNTQTSTLLSSPYYGCFNSATSQVYT